MNNENGQNNSISSKDKNKEIDTKQTITKSSIDKITLKTKEDKNGNV